jgi:hypothetical protein
MARLCGSDCRGCYERLLGELEYRYAISDFDGLFYVLGWKFKIYIC